MKNISRRLLIAGSLGATLLAAGCGDSVTKSTPETIDARVDAALQNLFETTPGAQKLADDSVGMLVMPLVTEAGFGFGGAYGRGALRIGDVSVDYYSVAEGSFGAQIGAQQFAYVLFFMTEEALQGFRSSPGVAAGADLKMTVMTDGEQLAANTKTAAAPVIAVVFGRTGVIAGATLEGQIYSRIKF